MAGHIRAGGRAIGLIDAAIGEGAGDSGCKWGGAALREAGLVACLAAAGRQAQWADTVASEPARASDRFDSVEDFTQRLAASVGRVLAMGQQPVVVGGDHSIACGTVAGISSYYHKRKKKIGLIWFDAHGDMNTPESSESGNIHGMPLACCIGRGLPELTKIGDRLPMVDVEKAVLIGARTLDPRERQEIKDSKIHVFTLKDIDMHGVHKVMKMAIEIASAGTAGFHLSFDMDGTDPSVAPGVGTPVMGGTTFRESHLIMEHAAESRKLLGLEITEINPILDNQNATARVAVDLVMSALGKGIL